MTTGFRTKVFAATFTAAAASVLLAGGLVSWSLRHQMLERIERGLIAQTRLAAQLLSGDPARPGLADPDDEADALAETLDLRVTSSPPMAG